MPMIESIKLTNLLSFGPDSPELGLRPLNVLIGPNGSGKSNLLEAISLLRATPADFTRPIKGIAGGGISEWLWKGAPRRQSVEATLEVTIGDHSGKSPIRHRLCFGEHGKRFELRDEAIECASPRREKAGPEFFYRFQRGTPVLNALNEADGSHRERPLRREDLDPERSILSQRRDPDLYPELYQLAELYSRIRIYPEWWLGRTSPQRLPHPADGRTDFLSEQHDNLGLVLSQIQRDADANQRLLEALEALYEGITNVGVIVESGSAQVYFHEGRVEIPSTRLSDGTMRYLCLLAILCHPSPPPLICMEEPELGLHPDAIPEVAKLLRTASQRTQLIVTTHSPTLVDAFTEDPESIVVCEKHEGQSHLRRLDAGQLEGWLGDFSLGKLWRAGEVGGNRW